MIKIFIKRWFIILPLFAASAVYADERTTHCASWPNWLKPSCLRIHQIWTEGSNELYLTGYAWHNRYTYDPKRVRQYNEAAWGGGAGKGIIDERGNWQGLYAFAFLESHKKIQPIAGYAYLKMFTLAPLLQTGVGFTAFITARPDINKGIPFPGVLPAASLAVNKFSLAAAYVPGRRNIGNVLFIYGKYTFN